MEPFAFENRLAQYAVAAVGAGVGVLALTSPAEGRIVYTQTDVEIDHKGQSIALDINNDGITDFTIVEFRENHYPSLPDLQVVVAGSSGGVIAVSYPGQVYPIFARALQPGYPIGSRRTFLRSNKLRHGYLSMAYASYYLRGGDGPWADVAHRYLGLRFKLDGAEHFGWAQLSVRVLVGGDIRARLEGYAYETDPGKPILAGQTKDTTSASTTPQDPPR
jgi:hypothetical protein